MCDNKREFYVVVSVEKVWRAKCLNWPIVTRDHAPRYQGRFERYTGTFTLYFPSHHKLEREFFKKSWGNWKLLLRVWTTALPIEGDDGLAHCPGPTAPFTRPWHCPRQIGLVGRFCMGAEGRFTAQNRDFRPGQTTRTTSPCGSSACSTRCALAPPPARGWEITQGSRWVGSHRTVLGPRCSVKGLLSAACSTSRSTRSGTTSATRCAAPGWVRLGKFRRHLVLRGAYFRSRYILTGSAPTPARSSSRAYSASSSAPRSRRRRAAASTRTG